MRLTHASIALGLLSLTPSPNASAQDPGKFAQPLPVEEVPSVQSLPPLYPKDWVLIQDFHFNALIDGRLAIVDTKSPDLPLKGTLRAAQFANVLYSRSKNEIYTSETFYSRLTRGERTDAITIWDTATLQPKGEIVLPGGKRQQSVTYTGVFQFTNAEKWALIANFTPAQSVTVVDLDGRKVLGEIDLPGCTHIYPTGNRGFSSLCADGSMISVALDENGSVASSATIANVQDIDKQPLFGMPAMVGRTAWFVSYYGELRGFDLSGDVARPTGSASVGTASGGDPEWRPGGWQVIASDARGLLYVLMTPHGREGSHKDGGTQVWVIDPATGTRARRIDLEGMATSIAVTREDAPQLVIARPDGAIAVFDAATGKPVRNLGATVAFNPLVIMPVQ
ncbi:amine dehydrogenase large subunit [Novosphingobium sp. PP1Y]|uniref:amine dehydrogenase large subunit n=1 Tax=Novosphingobium sp. PP1Y TaxID=702113 RepID=UPI00020EFB13|nr:amine dehydrogenase large subunit [Novosphingobium sp. PP1Y]CCA90604.1 amine dehydrogenase [Novosphingobium sp. PP1Y]